MDAWPVGEATAWLRSRVGVLPALIVALDDWARYRRLANDEAGMKTLTDLAQALDADPWRRRVREALAAKDMRTLDELAGSDEVPSQAPGTVELLAQVLRNNGRPERALDVLGKTLRQHPGDFWLHFEAALANETCRPRRDDEAACHYTAALALLRPRSVGVLHNLGGVRRAQGKLDEAVACWRQAIELDPNFAKPYDYLGHALRDQGKLDEAIACHNTAIRLDPKDASGNLAADLRDQGKLDEAIAYCRKGVELDPKSAAARIPLGNVLTKQQKLNEAVACYREAVALDPKEPLAHTNLGVALANQGKLDEAIACYRKASNGNPPCEQFWASACC